LEIGDFTRCGFREAAAFWLSLFGARASVPVIGSQILDHALGFRLTQLFFLESRLSAASSA